MRLANRTSCEHFFNIGQFARETQGAVNSTTLLSVNLKTWTQCVQEKACARNHSYNVNREHNTSTDIIQHSTLMSRFHETQTLQYTVNFTIDKTQSMKLIKVQSIALGVSFSKAQSSKLEHLFCHVSVRREVRALNFELKTPFKNVAPSGIGLHFWIHCQSSKYSQSHLGCHFRKLKAQCSNISFATFQ